ncbi:2-oxoglutarate dehydrogenase, E2 component, dihydrolipoamide succinyltransferase [Desertihabitans brevis]|uniref:Dihydrolipoamide acetyltransferase component of pyruvate dehydrogenase complex n=1 Tax=Desertihabitans brevis TaxID=2268447 RepID=A0A367YX41_9ACTN|nr:2-oxoglutarate dehydrogenase, E2 component, dihydrolipoamide succinyltransferase [Desertihabitans brevis]RCK69511.1 2-oxoglutarate dehydrogenase, E2 component, dihydrolipoamide succinyltransferase [Desertihabitans brevis]
MSTSVPLPALGESVTEGTVSRWLKEVGDTVEADEALLEVSTDKVDTEIPSPVAGTLLEIKVAEDETVEVGAVLAIIGDADEAAGSDAGDQGGQAEAEQPVADQTGAREDASGGQGTDTQSQQPAQAEQASDLAEQEQPRPSGSSAGGAGTNVELPALGESVTEGTVSRWLKQVGDTVEADEALLEVSTDKVDTEIPSPVAGTLLEIKVAEDETVEVGAVLAVIGDASSAAGGDAAPAPEQPAAEEPSSAEGTGTPVEEVEDQTAAGDEGGQEPVPAPDEAPKVEEVASGGASAAPQQQESPAPEEKARPAQQSGGDRPQAAPRATGGGEAETYVTPLVRKLAAQHGVDLSSVTGTGVGGRIRKQDVLAAAEEAKKPAAAPAAEAPAAQPSAPAAAAPEVSDKRGTTEKMSRLRKTIATRMVDSLKISAQLTATVEVDLTAISRLRAKHKDEFAKREGARLSYLPFITKAVAETLKAFPGVNATVDTEAGTITYPGAEHIGIAVDTEKGLLVPVIKDAGDLNLAGIAKKIVDLAERTRTNKLSPDDLSGGTFTITNYGSTGTLMDTPIINQPQVAILGTGVLVKRPVVLSDPDLGETIAIRDMMYLSMTYDHRVVDGADAGRFLSALKKRLEGGDFASELS